MINTRKKLFDVALEHPCGASMVFTDLIDKLAEAIDGLVCPLPNLTRKRIVDEIGYKERIENPVDRMMQETIAHRGFVNVAEFGIVDFEMLIGTVNVGFSFEIIVKIKDVIHEMQAKLLHILLVPLASDKLAPRE